MATISSGVNLSSTFYLRNFYKNDPSACKKSSRKDFSNSKLSNEDSRALHRAIKALGKFEYTEEYFDLVNFFQSIGYKVKSDNLKTISREERKARIKKIRNCVEYLDEITNNFWSGDSAWEQAIDYIISNR